MPFWRRKTVELDKEEIEERFDEGLLEEDEEEEAFDDGPGSDSSEEEPYDEPYDDEPYDDEPYDDEPYEDEPYDESYDKPYEETDEEPFSLDADEEASPAAPHERMSPVETGAWDYIHAEPNEDYLTDTGNFRFDLDGPEGGVFLPEESPKEDAPRKVHVRKKHKKHHYLLKFFSACVLITLLILFMKSSYFNINKITVEGIVNFSEEQIVEMSGLKKGQNLFEIKAGKAEEAIEADPHIQKATIKRDLPKGLVITIEERLPAAQLKYEEQYIAIDADGFILSVGDKVDGATVLKGLTIKSEHVTAGTDLSVKEGAALDEALALMKTAAQEGITFKTMDMSEKTIRLYLTKDLLIKGKPAVIKRHIENGDITLILKDLEEKEITKGTIKATTEESFTFSPDKE